MKKNLILIAFAAMMVCSCSTIRKTATVMDVQSVAQSENTAELEISPKRITYEYRPSASERRGGAKNVLNCATAAALKSNGEADVLVQREHTIRTSKNLFGVIKIKEVTVTGYPAKYKNFKSK